ncbi:hypothetical protein MBLNU457_g2433t1 [Dothideomycetes sp. NU457]
MQPLSLALTGILRFRELKDIEGIGFAVLYHIEDEDEILFEDVHDNERDRKSARALKERKPKSFETLARAVEEARGNSNHLLFVSSCCIDKRSQLEVSEASHSLHTWYSKADRCYAYLADVQSGLEKADLENQFTKSRWFARDSTSEELLWSKNLCFYSATWEYLGTREDFCELITRVTGIEPHLLCLE